MLQRIVVVGASLAGLRAVETLRDRGFDGALTLIGDEPHRRDLKLKLLEVFFVWGNKEQFLTTARELSESRGSAEPGEWEKIVIMGKQIAPEDPMFADGNAGGAVGVDLNLDGGGSASMWAFGQTVSSPSEGQERPIANGLVLVKKPKR